MVSEINFIPGFKLKEIKGQISISSFERSLSPFLFFALCTFFFTINKKDPHLLLSLFYPSPFPPQRP